MQWNNKGIVLNTSLFGERDMRVSLFTRDHGRYHAMVKGGATKQNRADWQMGNVLHVHWNARLIEHMGNFRGELLTPYAALLMGDATTLAALTSACSLLERAMLERDPHPQLYDAFEAFLVACAGGRKSSDWLSHYALLEYCLLQESGYGLDVSCCAATGGTEGLLYISPKSGRAVCAVAGAPYHHKMLPLTRLIADESTEHSDDDDTFKSLEVTGYFLHHWLFAAHHHQMPEARRRLMEKVCVSETLAIS